MQNQYSENNNHFNQTNYQWNNQTGGNGPSRDSNKNTKYYVLGLFTGILASLSVMFMVVGAMKFYRIIDSAKNANSIEKQAQTESITNTGVEKKLGILEDTIEKHFWKEVDTTSLEMDYTEGF